MDAETKAGWVDVTVAPEKETTKYWLGNDIEKSIEDCLGIGGDDIASLAKSPSNWVGEPNEESQAPTHDESFGSSVVGDQRIPDPIPRDGPCDQGAGENCYSEETPLV